MSDLIVSARPDNFRSDFGSLDVTGDVYMICDRIKAQWPWILVRERSAKSNGRYRYVISEMCVDNQERWVFGTDALDGRVIEHIEYLLRVPFQQRFAESERIEAQREQERKDSELDMLYETIGAPMLPLLERTGFTQRPRSYPKRGVSGGRGSARKS